MAKIIRTILSVVIQNTESLHENTDFKSNENQKPESFRNFVVRSIKNDENILIKHRNRYRFTAASDTITRKARWSVWHPDK